MSEVGNHILRLGSHKWFSIGVNSAWTNNIDIQFARNMYVTFDDESIILEIQLPFLKTYYVQYSAYIKKYLSFFYALCDLRDHALNRWSIEIARHYNDIDIDIWHKALTTGRKNSNMFTAECLEFLGFGVVNRIIEIGYKMIWEYHIADSYDENGLIKIMHDDINHLFEGGRFDIENIKI